MDEMWQQIAQQIHDLPAYIALLRSHELPTRIVSALDCLPQSSSGPAVPQDTERIISLLLQMIESKWSFGFLSSDHQRLLDYAHDWASETLLALVAPSGSDQAMACESSEAVEAMQRELFSYRTETEDDRLQEIERSIQDVLASHGVSISAGDLTDLLEVCANCVDDDGRFVELVELIIASGSRRELSAMGASFRARILTTEHGRRLLGSLSVLTRLRVWESNLALWTEQLDQWLHRVHAKPFVPVSVITGFTSLDLRAPSSPLYVALIVWATKPARRKWLRATRSRELLAAVSRVLRDDRLDLDAFSRRLLTKVPHAMSERPSHQWSLKQRGFVLRSVAQALTSAAQDSRHQWHEFIGLVERLEIVQHALDALVTLPAREDTAETERTHGVQIFAWYEAFLYDVRGAQQKEVLVSSAIDELAQALGVLSVSQSGVQWLQEHRSETFATLTGTRLRIAWRWLLQGVYSSPLLENVREVLESIEYIIRRHAPANGLRSRPFQIEILASFLHDLEWCRSRHGPSDPTNESVGVVKAWLVKFVRLLPQEATDSESSTNLSQQLDLRLNTIGL